MTCKLHKESTLDSCVGCWLNIRRVHCDGDETDYTILENFWEEFVNLKEQVRRNEEFIDDLRSEVVYLLENVNALQYPECD